MNFTKSAVKKKVVKSNTNKMGQYYANVRVPIVNHNNASIATRIDKNMTNLIISDKPTNINLDDMLHPITSLNADTHVMEEMPKINMQLRSVNLTNEDSIINVVNNHREIHINEKIPEISMQLKVIDVLDDDSLVSVVTNHKENYVKESPALETSMQLKEINATIITGNSLIDELNYDIRKNDDLEEDANANAIQAYKKQKLDIIVNVLQIKKTVLENVYQEKYNNNINATGLGDFLRGSYFLMQFCDQNSIPFIINILNHPVSQFLEIYANKQPLMYKNINKFEDPNHHPHILNNHIITNVYDNEINNNFTEYLGSQQTFNNKIYIYVNTYPTINIDQRHKEYMKRILKPISRLQSIIDNVLTKLTLVKKNFTIIHIRCGDNYLIEKENKIKASQFERIQNTLDKLDLNQKYLLLADNNIIKNVLLSKYTFIKTFFNEITHTGEGLKLEPNKLQNTMIEFFLFSHAKNIIAFTTYKHETGFSKWIAETHSVPYSCKHLN